MQERLDLLLVNPGGRRQIYQALGENLAAIEPPVWAALMASYAKERGCSVEILDANALDLAPEATAAAVCERNPRLVAVVVYGHNPSASTQVMPSAGAICSAIKMRDPKQTVLLVGGHVAAVPERSLREEAADVVAGGEGLHALVGLIETLRSGSREFRRVPGLWYRDGDAIRTTAPPPLLEDLDRVMPGMAWDLLPMERYRAHNWHCYGELERRPYAALYTTLGCPYHCSFCCIQAPFKDGERAAGLKEAINSYRYWSPQAVLRQIEVLVERFGVRNIKFADEMFVLNNRHVGSICEGIIERGYDLNIWAYARVDTVKDGMIDKLRRAGFRWLAFGIEAADESVRRDVQKGYRRDDIRRTLARVREAGICVAANFIFGLPEDDHRTMQATLDLALELLPDYANFYCAMAYPGSALYERALAQGWELPASWSGYSQHSVDTLPLPTRHLPAAEVLRFRDEAFHTYFSDPGYLARMEATFGPDTVREIREMTAHRLVRRHVA